jgi:enoyl-CoA hydratase/carnithine racemase
VFETLSTARALAGDILRNSPLGVKLTKECLNMSLDAGSLEQVIAMEDRNQILCTRGEDFREGVRAFLEKWPAKFRDAKPRRPPQSRAVVAPSHCGRIPRVRTQP